MKWPTIRTLCLNYQFKRPLSNRIESNQNTFDRQRVDECTSVIIVGVDFMIWNRLFSIYLAMRSSDVIDGRTKYQWSVRERQREGTFLRPMLLPPPSLLLLLFRSLWLQHIECLSSQSICHEQKGDGNNAIDCLIQHKIWYILGISAFLSLLPPVRVPFDFHTFCAYVYHILYFAIHRHHRRNHHCCLVRKQLIRRDETERQKRPRRKMNCFAINQFMECAKSVVWAATAVVAAVNVYQCIKCKY